MFSFFINTINAFIRGLGAVLTFVLAILPNSPFQAFIKSDSVVMVYLKYINYIVPVLTFVAILEAYLAAIAIYYIVQIVLRWLKVVE